MSEQLHTLIAGERVVFGGDRVTTVSPNWPKPSARATGWWSSTRRATCCTSRRRSTPSPPRRWSAAVDAFAALAQATRRADQRVLRAVRCAAGRRRVVRRDRRRQRCRRAARRRSRPGHRSAHAVAAHARRHGRRPAHVARHRHSPQPAGRGDSARAVDGASSGATRWASSASCSRAARTCSPTPPACCAPATPSSSVSAAMRSAPPGPSWPQPCSRRLAAAGLPAVRCNWSTVRRTPLAGHCSPTNGCRSPSPAARAPPSRSWAPSPVSTACRSACTAPAAPGWWPPTAPTPNSSRWPCSTRWTARCATRSTSAASCGRVSTTCCPHSVPRSHAAASTRGVEPIIHELAPDDPCLAHEWEWDTVPEVAVMIVDDVAQAVEQFNRFSPHFVASLDQRRRRRARGVLPQRRCAVRGRRFHPLGRRPVRTAAARAGPVQLAGRPAVRPRGSALRRLGVHGSPAGHRHRPAPSSLTGHWSSGRRYSARVTRRPLALAVALLLAACASGVRGVQRPCSRPDRRASRRRTRPTPVPATAGRWRWRRAVPGAGQPRHRRARTTTSTSPTTPTTTCHGHVGHRPVAHRGPRGDHARRDRLRSSRGAGRRQRSRVRGRLAGAAHHAAAAGSCGRRAAPRHRVHGGDRRRCTRRSDWTSGWFNTDGGSYVLNEPDGRALDAVQRPPQRQGQLHLHHRGCRRVSLPSPTVRSSTSAAEPTATSGCGRRTGRWRPTSSSC